MILSGVMALFFAIDAECKGLESMAPPLSAVEEEHEQMPHALEASAFLDLLYSFFLILSAKSFSFLFLHSR